MRTFPRPSAPLVAIALLVGCSSPSPSKDAPADSTPEAEPAPTGISVKLRWDHPSRDAVVPAVADVAECAEGPAGRLVVGEDQGLADAIVHVPAAPGLPQAPAEVLLVAAGCRFSPAAVVVPPSTPLRFTNEDGILHTFHLWRRVEDGERNHQNVAVPPGVPGPRLVLDPGRYRVTSDRFDHMEAWILVAPAGTAGVTDASGRLELPGLPAGEYEVSVSHPAAAPHAQTVTVPQTGPAALHLDLKPAPQPSE